MAEDCRALIKPAIVEGQAVPLDTDVNFRGVGEGGMIIVSPTLCNAWKRNIELADISVRCIALEQSASRVTHRKCQPGAA